MIFKHWKELPITPVQLDLNQDHFHYIQARAWGLKGWLGGTHSWFTFWCQNRREWLVLELTDKETLDYQSAEVIFAGSNDYLERAPFISNRDPRQQWFGAKPTLIDSIELRPNLSYIEKLNHNYPFPLYKLLTQNCNTYTSYLYHHLDLKQMNLPLRKVGHRGSRFWQKFTQGAGINEKAFQ